MYRVHEFARLAGVTVKALHHYDRLGLLRPSRSQAGYRIYADRDIERLERIVALKFIGFPLKQIKTLLDRNALELPAALRVQRGVIEEKRRRLDRVLAAIRNAEQATDRAALRKIIEEDPAGERAQALAMRWRDLRVSDAAGDPRIHEGLIKAWHDRRYWPQSLQNHLSEFHLDEISAFIARAFGCYRRKHYGDLPLPRQLEAFPPEERERLPLAQAALYFNLAQALDEDPAGERAQALAARWMELMESGTGVKPPSNEEYGAMVQRAQNWPPAFVRELAMLDRGRIAEFVLRACAQKKSTLSPSSLS